MDFDTLYLRVLKYLNYRPRSEKEVRDYIQKTLKRRVIPTKVGIQGNKEWILGTRARDDSSTGVTDLIIHKLKQQKFLNDYEFARMWVRSRTNFKPKGWRLITLELKQKGISSEIIESLESSSKNQAEDQDEKRPSEVDLAVGILEQKKKKYVGMERQERFNKAGSMLARRGFDLDVIRAAMDKVFGK